MGLRSIPQAKTVFFYIYINLFASLIYFIVLWFSFTAYFRLKVKKGFREFECYFFPYKLFLEQNAQFSLLQYLLFLIKFTKSSSLMPFAMYSFVPSHHSIPKFSKVCIFYGVIYCLMFYSSSTSPLFSVENKILLFQISVVGVVN